MYHPLIRIRRFVPHLIFLFSLILLAGCSQPIHHGLDEEQANEMLVVLQQNGINASKVPEEGGETLTFTVTVSGRDAAKAWQILKEHSLPRPTEKGFGEVFGQTSLIPTAMEEKALFLQAMTGELAKTVEAIPGVIDARVHVVLPESDVLKEELQGPTTPKAAVYIKYKTDQNGLPPFKDDDIRNLVANSVEGLQPKNVAVVSSEVYPDKPLEFVYAGPLKISKESVFTFQVFLIALVALFIVVGIMLIFAARSSMSLRKELEELRVNSSRLPDIHQ